MTLRVLVTGGAGFIGSHTVETLSAAGLEVAVVDDLSSGRRNNLAEGVPLFVGDVADEAFIDGVVETVRPEVIVHEAAQVSVSRSMREPRADARTNVLGLLAVLEAARRHGTRRLVFASTGGALYGDVEAPASENHLLAPVSPYGVAKLAGEAYLRAYHVQYGFEYAALRYANVYGPRQDPHGEAGVVAIFSRRLLDGKRPVIFGDGTAVRDYVYVGDVARANLLAVLAPEVSGPYNVGTGVPTDVLTLATWLQEMTAVEATPEFAAPRPGDLQRSILAANRVRDELGWQPAVDLREGLMRTVAWFVAHAV